MTTPKFEKQACWDRSLVHRVMDPDALQVQQHLFMATHTPTVMVRQRSTAVEEDGAPFTEAAFLAEFLDDLTDHAVVAVIGDSGAGKSHLIRWMGAQIQKTARRRVIPIPKIKTNLRDVIELILEDMPQERFQVYRDRLVKAAGTLTVGQAKERLLNRLTELVGPENYPDRSDLEEEDEWLVDNLQVLLYNAKVRETLLKPGSVIDQLAFRAVGDRETVEVVEEPREFQESDLPLDTRTFKSAGDAVIDTISQLVSDPDLKHRAVEWLNKHLGEAVSQIIDFGGNFLLKLMLEVREALAEQNVELILLIEDFALLQGIDTQLMEAMVTRPKQDKPLCHLRAAFACTKGYIRTLKPTHLGRLSFVVNVDSGEVTEGGRLTPESLNKFAARYLNAVRLKESETRAWYDRGVKSGHFAQLPNACAGCPFQGPCHAAFGEIEGIGLYPFTAKALKRMHRRMRKDGTFVARFFIKDVLKYPLDNYRDDVIAGRFPSNELHTYFGGVSADLTPATKARIQRLPDADRHRALLDLWTDGRELVNQPQGVFDAFALTPIDGVPYLPDPGPSVQSDHETSGDGHGAATDTAKPDTEEGGDGNDNAPADPAPQSAQAPVSAPAPPPAQPGPSPKASRVPNESEIPAELEEKLKHIRSWANQAQRLPQGLAEELRNAIFEALLEHIPWDTERLLSDGFMGPRTCFERGGIVFLVPDERPTLTSTFLPIPLSPLDRESAAFALEAFLLWGHFRHWSFKDGTHYLIAFGHQLEQWSQHALNKFRRYPTANYAAAWDPAPALAEVLAIGARLLGHPLGEGSVPGYIDSMFLGLNEAEGLQPHHRTPTWTKLSQEFQKHRKPLQTLLMNHVPLTKGGEAKIQVLDAARIERPLSELLVDWRPKTELPKLSTAYESLQEVRRLLDEKWSIAIVEEKEAHLAWLERATGAFGDDPDQHQILEAVLDALTAAMRDGRVRGINREGELKPHLDAFRTVDLKATMAYARALKVARGPAEEVQLLANAPITDLQTIGAFIDIVESFLSASLTFVEDEVKHAQAGSGAALRKVRVDIDEAVAGLAKVVSELKGVTT